MLSPYLTIILTLQRERLDGSFIQVKKKVDNILQHIILLAILPSFKFKYI